MFFRRLGEYDYIIDVYEARSPVLAGQENIERTFGSWNWRCAARTALANIQTAASG